MLSISQSTFISALYPGVMSITEYATIVPSSDNSALYAEGGEVMSTIEYVTIVPRTDSRVDFSIRKNSHPENVS